MGGGVAPWEWVVAPLFAGPHALYNATASAAEMQNAQLITPGSPADKQKDAEDEANALADQQRQAADVREQERIAALPQDARAQFESRKRAGAAASQVLAGGKRRASQLLSTPSSLGVSA